MTYQEIWETLSQIDVSKHIQKKGNLNFLSWAWAWGELMKIYPQATYEFLPPIKFDDGSVEVQVTIIIDECSRMMWLPVMDYKNNAVLNPDSRQISDSKMRCLVKCMAMFGLGHYIYAGEDLPQEATTYTSEQKQKVADILERNAPFELLEFRVSVNDEVWDSVLGSAQQGEKVAYKKKINDMLKSADAMLEDHAGEMKIAINEQNVDRVLELVSELTTEEQKKRVWAKLNPADKSFITEALKESENE